MSTLGVLAQMQQEKDDELIERGKRDLFGHDVEEMDAPKNRYKLALKKKGTGSILRQALQAGADSDELELLRQLKFVRGS